MTRDPMPLASLQLDEAGHFMQEAGLIIAESALQHFRGKPTGTIEELPICCCVLIILLQILINREIELDDLLGVPELVALAAFVLLGEACGNADSSSAAGGRLRAGDRHAGHRVGRPAVSTVSGAHAARH